MIKAVADTHAVIWYLMNDGRLSVTARNFIQMIEQQGHTIGVAAITFVEIIYLIERSKIPAESLSRLARELLADDSVLAEVILDLQIARTLSMIDRDIVPEISDRIIAATALHLNVPIISRDMSIPSTGLQIIW